MSPDAHWRRNLSMRRDGRRRSPNQITVSSSVPICSYEREIEFLVGGVSSPTRK
jgi:hypothetical protein